MEISLMIRSVGQSANHKQRKPWHKSTSVHVETPYQESEMKLLRKIKTE